MISETSRISAERKKQPKVNLNAAARILNDDSKHAQVTKGLLDDPRFRELWEREEFRIDESNPLFKNKKTNPKKVTSDEIAQLFESVDEDVEDEMQDVQVEAEPGKMTSVIF